MIDLGDLKPKQATVKFRGKHYVLREASEAAYCAWQNLKMARTKYGEDGRLESLGEIADAEPLLVSGCLFEAEEPPEGQEAVLRLMPNGDPDPRFTVPLGVVRAWPNRAVRPLHEWIVENSDILTEETRESLEKRIRRDVGRLSKFPGAAEFVAGLEVTAPADPTPTT